MKIKHLQLILICFFLISCDSKVESQDKAFNLTNSYQEVCNKNSEKSLLIEDIIGIIYLYDDELIEMKISFLEALYKLKKKGKLSLFVNLQEDVKKYDELADDFRSGLDIFFSRSNHPKTNLIELEEIRNALENSQKTKFKRINEIPMNYINYVGRMRN